MEMSQSTAPREQERRFDVVLRALGGGVGYAITNNFTVKVEGLYVNLDRGGDDTVFTTGILNNQDDLEFGVVRAGLNYKF
jgi:outer membrane immunogenic protein